MRYLTFLGLYLSLSLLASEKVLVASWQKRDFPFWVVTLLVILTWAGLLAAFAYLMPFPLE